MLKEGIPASAGKRMKRRQSRTIRRSRRIAMQQKRRNRRSSVGEIFNLTPGKAANENDTLAARSAEHITRPTLHPADLIFVRTVKIDPHPADLHRVDHKKFDILQTLHAADITFLTRCRR